MFYRELKIFLLGMSTSLFLVGKGKYWPLGVFMLFVAFFASNVAKKWQLRKK